MLIPNPLNNYAIWLGGNRFLGMADVTLPNLTNLTDELKGAGLGGTINMPVAAHFDDWTVTYNFHTITPEGCELLRQDGVLVEARVVGGDERIARVARREDERFPDLQTARAGGDVVAQHADEARAEVIV